MAEHPPIPASENDRLKALRSYKILDTGAETAYDAITRLASYICQVPIAAITLIDDHRQWHKSTAGIDLVELPLTESFCRYTILTDQIYEVEDTLKNELFANNTLVTAPNGIRFYAGAPLIDHNGYRLGSLCVLDNKPRQLTAEQRDALQTLSAEVISNFTLRRQKEELEATVLRQKEFYNLFNTSPDIHCITNASTDIEIVNESFTKILGYPAAEVVGQPLMSFLVKEDNNATVNDLQEKIAGKKTFELQTRVNTSTGEVKWVSWCVANRDDKWYISGRDNTLQKQISAELEELSLVASKINNGVAIMDATNRITWVNDVFAQITGFDITDARGKQLSEFLRGDYDNEVSRRKTDHLLQSKQSFEVELQVNHKDGRLIWLYISNSVVVDKTGNVEKYIKVISDITARKRAEHDVNVLSFAARRSPSGILIRDNKARVIWMNKAFENITGYTLDEMKGKSFDKALIGEESDRAVFEKAVEAVKNSQPYDIEMKIYRKDGKPIWVMLTNSPFFNEEGQVERQIGVMVDISERKANEQQLEQLSLVARNTTSGVVINNADGEVEWVNNAFSQITGYSISDVHNKHLGDVLRGELTDVSIIQKARDLSRNKQSFEVDLLVYRKDGQPLWISVINSVIIGSNGKVDKYIEVIIDITAKKKAELGLIQAKEEALQLSRAKEMFISVMSHEIRTPLNAVIGISHLLLKDNPQPSQTENLNILKFSADNLMSLINDVLDFTKIETGNIQLEKTDVNLRDMIQSVTSSMQYKAVEKNIYIKHRIDDAMPTMVIGDRTRLVQILLNLVSNAVKFTEQGGVTIETHLVEQTPDTAKIRFSIADTGIGIAPDKLGSIFELWKQAEMETTRKYGGTGLGLAISKRLVTLHDSKLNVDSVPGHGATFWFTITFDKTQNQIPNNKNKVEEALNVNVLVVDDNQINRLLINKVLKKWGATADFAENGAEAVDKIRQNQNYDVVLMDIHMPVMGGLEATRNVRSINEPYYQQLPIIALTASMLNDQMGEITDAGMNDYVLKPFEPKMLYDKLARHQKQ